jgi:hypothetical protein
VPGAKQDPAANMPNMPKNPATGEEWNPTDGGMNPVAGSQNKKGGNPRGE